MIFGTAWRNQRNEQKNHNDIASTENRSLKKQSIQNDHLKQCARIFRQESTFMSNILGTSHTSHQSYDPQWYGIAERIVQTLKMESEPFSRFNRNIGTYQFRWLLSYRIILLAERKRNHSMLMGRLVKKTITMSFSITKNVGYWKDRESNRKNVYFKKGITQKY